MDILGCGQVVRSLSACMWAGLLQLGGQVVRSVIHRGFGLLLVMASWLESCSPSSLDSFTMRTVCTCVSQLMWPTWVPI